MSYYRSPPQRPSGGIGFPPLTPMVRTIMIINGVIWAAQFLLGPVMGVAGLSRILGLVPALVLQGWVWQPITYMWLHSSTDPFHIILNMLFLWMLGGDLERHWGSRAFLRYYLVCGIGAGLFITVGGLFQNPLIPTVGASGAVYGLILAFGKVFSERVILFMLIFPMRARTFAWIMFAVTFVFTLQHSAPRGHGGGLPLPQARVEAEGVPRRASLEVAPSEVQGHAAQGRRLDPLTRRGISFRMSGPSRSSAASIPARHAHRPPIAHRG